MNKVVQHSGRASPDFGAQLDKIREMLRLQLEELEMLSSMFPNSGELVLTDPSVVADINEFVNCKTSSVPLHLDFTINLAVDNLKLELCANLASIYPVTEPDIFVRSDQLHRNQQTQLNADLSNYIASLERGEICICSVVIWLQENAVNYHQKVDITPMKRSSKEEKESFSRLWIYSHHIYNNTKRKEILELAQNLNLTGFCLPGKPGIICVEGPTSSCNQWWQGIRSMTWQKIMCKKVEEEVVKSGKDLDSFRKFSRFQEISFVNEHATTKETKHMNMGEFYRYLRENDCGEVFKDYFGVDGKLPDAP